MSASRVFTIPAGVPFLDALAQGVLEESDGEPFALADTLILLPTRRGARDLAEAFLRVSQGRALALPRIVPLGDVDEDLSAMDAPAAPLHADDDIPPAIAETRRQILLAAMVQKFARDPALRAADQAIRLAAALADFIDRAHAERVSLDRLGSLVPERFAAHWQETLAFLTIATAHWPAVLAAEGVIDPADRQNRVLERLSQRWSEQPPDRRIVAAGSTGSIPATADVLRAVSRLPRGAVVLPGLDRDADEASWAELASDPHHPQHGLARLLAHIGSSREEVEDWPHLSDPPPSPGRARLVSETMRPAATSESWRDLQAVLSRDAAEGLARVDCPSPAEESQVIALALRHALETPGRTAALVTPDRSLARRVAAELGRWQIEIDDSAGVPLGSTPPGAFLRLVAEMVEESFSPVPLLAALKHPLASGGIPTAAFRARVRDLERAVLRGPRPAAGLAGLRRALGAARLSESERAALSSFVNVIEGATKDFAAALGRADDDLASALHAHVRMAEALAASEDEPGAARLWAGEAGEAAARAIADLGEALRGAHRLTLNGGSYAALFETLVGRGAVRPKFGRHPRLRILGPLEARLHIADLVVLGGLNEGTWPHRPPTDPWLSRSMQLEMALDDPERRIGLAAHDVAQLLAAPEVLLTRAARVEGTPTVPSRWLSRLDTVLVGAGLLSNLVAAGRWISGPEAAGGALARAKRLDDPGDHAPWPRPAPRPPVSARPRRLRVTDIERLMDDPYRVYARTVLKLSALDALDADPGAAERGEILHDALHMFLRDAPEQPELDRLIAAGRRAFSRAGVPPSVAAYWWPRFERLAAWVLEELGRQAREGRRVAATERDGALVVPAPGGPITIAGRADRIDRAADGSLAIIDYKSGNVPKTKEVKFGYAPQLPLLAAIAEDGRFKDLPAAAVGAMAYWRITGGDPPGKVEEREASIEETRMGLARLLAEFDDEDTAYAAAEDPESDYAHLARVKEWS